MSREPVIVVLAHGHDHGASAVARAIAARRGEDAVLRLSPADLTRAGWTHTIGAGGEVGGAVLTASGHRLAAGGVACVLDRLTAVLPPAFARAEARERDYAAAEMQALVLSWLTGLGCPVIRSPGAVGLSRRQWLARAIRAGIPVEREVAATSARLVPGEPVAPSAAGRPVEVRDHPGGPLRSVLVAGDRLHGDVDRALAGPCLALAADTGCGLLSLMFAARLVDVDPFPPLADEASVGATAALLERLGGATA